MQVVAALQAGLAALEVLAAAVLVVVALLKSFEIAVDLFRSLLGRGRGRK